MKIREIKAKSILSTSRVYDYALNPVVGCHGCVYCYAKFMKRFTGHKEKWGEFVDIKINAPDLLAREVKKKKGRQGLDKRRVRSLSTFRKEVYAHEEMS